MEKPLMLTIKDTYKLWAGYMKSLAAEAGVPDSYRGVLTYLSKNPGANQKEVAAHRNITNASISRIVKEMQMTGYLEKETSQRDQRYVKLYLTEKGEACAKEIRKKIHAADDIITASFTAAREKELISMLNELSEIIEKELIQC